MSDVKSNAATDQRPPVRHRARRSERRPASDEGRRQCRPAAHRAALRAQRHGGHHLYERANRWRAGVHVRARGAARRHRQVPGAEAAIDRDRKGRSIFSTASERARDQQAEPGRSRLVQQAPDNPAPFADRSAIRTSRPMPTTSSAAIARSRCWARCKRLAEFMGGIRGRRKAIADVQRRHRLSDLRHLRLSGRHDRHDGDARRDCGSGAGQCQLLRRRPPRPRRHDE